MKSSRATALFIQSLALTAALPSALMAAPRVSAPAPRPEAVEGKSLELLDDRFLADEGPEVDLVPARVRIDELKMGHARVQQTVDGIPVFEGEAIVHLNRDGSLFGITDHLVRGIQLDTTPDLAAEEAITLARLEDGRQAVEVLPPKAELMVFARQGAPRLTWRVDLSLQDEKGNPSRPVFFIDAHSGEVALHFDNLQHISATGASLYSGTVSFESDKISSTKYFLEDTVRKIGTFSLNNQPTGIWRIDDPDNFFDQSYDRAGVDAHWGARQAYDYFQTYHNRTGIDGAGGPTTSVSFNGVPEISLNVHAGSNYNNAYWDPTGKELYFGDGDGAMFSSLVSVDVVGHEWTHGVIQYEANLTYSGESGALNESFADVFGAMIEFNAMGWFGNWQMGEACYTPATAGDALRTMNNPHSASNKGFTADDDPDHYSERYTGSGDYGGVHINSGIGNKAFTLLADGGSHHKGGSMNGIGRSVAAKIWYSALANYMTAGTNFSGARTATLNAAKALYGSGSTQYAAVGQAWTLVGVN